MKPARLRYDLETEEAEHGHERLEGGGNQPEKLIPRKIHRFSLQLLRRKIGAKRLYTVFSLQFTGNSQFIWKEHHSQDQGMCNQCA